MAKRFANFGKSRWYEDARESFGFGILQYLYIAVTQALIKIKAITNVRTTRPPKRCGSEQASTNSTQNEAAAKTQDFSSITPTSKTYDFTLANHLLSLEIRDTKLAGQRYA